MGNDPGSAIREVGFAPRSGGGVMTLPGIGGLRPFWGFSRGEGGGGGGRGRVFPKQQ